MQEEWPMKGLSRKTLVKAPLYSRNTAKNIFSLVGDKMPSPAPKLVKAHLYSRKTAK
jgi:hypothetical protein